MSFPEQLISPDKKHYLGKSIWGKHNLRFGTANAENMSRKVQVTVLMEETGDPL